MRNYLVVGLYPNEICPAFTLLLAKSIKKMGNKVYAILPNNVENIDEWKKSFDEKNLCFLKINKKGKIDKYLNVLRFLVFNHFYLKNIKGITFDCVFFSFFHRWNSLIVSLINSKKYASFLHDPKMHSGESPKREKQLVNQMKKMDKLVILSRKFMEYTISTYEKNIEDVVFMPLCLFYGTRPLDSVEKNIDDSLPVNFLFFGRIAEYKGIDVLIEAYSLLKNDGYAASLTIAGNGDFSVYHKQFERLIDAKLVNRYIEDDEIKSLFYVKNTVVVVPYTDATQSGVISIAYSYGNPVIASETGGLKEQLDDGKLGIFSIPGNVNSLYENMKNICGNRNILRDQTRKMIEYSQNLNWDIATRNLFISLHLH